MSNPIETVWQVAEAATDQPRHVLINEAAIDRFVASTNHDPKSVDHSGAPIPVNPGGDLKLVWFELLACAVNYMYWYGSSHIRPNQSGAGKMYRLLAESFKEHKGKWDSDGVCMIFARKMVSERLPHSAIRYYQIRDLVPGRMSHAQWAFLEEVASQGDKTPAKKSSEKSSEKWIEELITLFPNFAQDMFLKRAFLFFGMLNRRYGWFADEIKDIPIPADYQIPKVLKCKGILQYSHDLSELINKSVIIPSGSIMEVEIRASSLMACRKLASSLQWTMMEVDDYLFSQRKNYDDPFHLTITTDY